MIAFCYCTDLQTKSSQASESKKRTATRRNGLLTASTAHLVSVALELAEWHVLLWKLSGSASCLVRPDWPEPCQCQHDELH